MKPSPGLAHCMMLPLLLGSSGSLVSAIGTLWVFSVVVGLYGLCIRALRPRLTETGRLLVSVLLAATLSSCTDVLAQRWFLPWQQAFGLYASLIALQCVVLEYNGFWRQTLTERGKLCALFGALLLLLGTLREAVGSGSLGRGPFDSWQGIVLSSDAIPLISLIPGAFIVLALLLAARQALVRPKLNSKEMHRP
ncbi:Rnf-Nqr domain containing protein [Pseudomonas granadensis]|uniref:Rnf-Nqr domain containing protein n=1 Tax=Pseudomonas granadensis TaxID=1421430 RepID=UPI00087945CD|nr:Rnf-Nqr domain containing protein [Pseudomonas granadensis]SDT46946.1 electron transport complex protein RnfE [Pseudomonas granadensis]